jgi:acetyl esterase
MSGPDENRTAIARKIRARGAILDMPLAQAIYKPLLAQQRRDGVEVTRDLRYGDGARHLLDVYRPLNARHPRRDALIFLHGGGFVRGDKCDRDNVGYYFARQGLVVVIPNYRLAPDDSWPAGAEDAVAVYRWVVARAGDLGIDSERIFLAGESAGAAHVATASLVRRFHPREGLHIRGAILISGVYNANLERLARVQFGVPTPDPRNEPYFGPDFASYRSMSTVELIDASPIPMLITYAELDLLQMQVQAGELFARLVTQHGFAPELKVIAGHNHLTQTYAVNTGDEALTRPILEFVSTAASRPRASADE